MNKHDHESEICAANSLSSFSEKIAFWSIGLIFFSIVFLLTLLFKGVDLAINLWYLSLSCYLYLGWALLAVSFLLGLVARRQNAVVMLKHEKKYEKDLRVINFIPPLFASGFIMLLVFTLGAVGPMIKIGIPRDCDPDHFHKTMFLMMKDLHHFEGHKFESGFDQNYESDKVEIKESKKRKVS